MKLLSLDVDRFRNIARARLVPSPRATILFGSNGQGKTNLLEAIYLLSSLRPLRSARWADLVSFGDDKAVVAGEFEAPGGRRRVAVEVSAGARTAYLDGKPQDRLEAYFEGLAAVCFSPDDLLLVKGGPEGRRRHLDRAAFNRWPAMLGEAREYVRALRERNAALRIGPVEVEASFREALIRTGSRLVRRRSDLVVEIAPRFTASFAEIAGAKSPEATLAYRSTAGTAPGEDESVVAARLADLLVRRLERDRERGYTSAGPHMDDVLLALDGRPARMFGSQGQQRALVLALKIAEIENLRQALGRPPLLLLDDVSSELDPAKNRYLLEYLGRLPAQVFLTTTDRRLLEPAAGPESAFYEVENGVLTRVVSP